MMYITNKLLVTKKNQIVELLKNKPATYYVRDIHSNEIFEIYHSNILCEYKQITKH